MKLMTHNFLASNVPGVNNGYPLKLTATQVESREVEFRPEFVTNVWGRIDYKVLRDAAASVRFFACARKGRRGCFPPFPWPARESPQHSGTHPPLWQT